MTDDEFDVMSKEVESILTSWKPYFGIENWALTINFHRGPIPGNEDAAGCCHSLWEYLDATLEFNLAELAEMDDHTREGVVIHELLHIIVDELKTKKGSPERVVTHLERILQRVKAAWDIEHGPKERNHCDRVEGVHRVLPQVRVGDGKQTHL